MEKKLKILNCLKLKGGNMYKKVLAVALVCLFAFSSVGFAKTLAPNCAVKSAIDNIAIKSVLANDSLNKAQLEKITEMFKAMAVNEKVNPMWIKLLQEKGITSLTDINTIAVNVKALNLQVLNDQTLEVPGVGYIYIDEGKIVLTDKEPGTKEGEVAVFNLTEEQKKGLDEQQQEKLINKMIEDAVNLRIANAQQMDSNEKDALKGAITEHITDKDEAKNKELQGFLETELKKAGKSTQEIWDTFAALRVLMSKIYTDENGNISIAHGSQRKGVMVLPTTEEMGAEGNIASLADLAFHEILEAMGLDHRTIRNIQKGVDRIKKDTIGQETSNKIQEFKKQAMAKAEAKEVNPVDEITQTIDTKVGKAEPNGLTPTEKATEVSAESVGESSVAQEAAASDQTEADLGIGAVVLKLTKGTGRLFGVETLKEFSLRSEERGENDADKVLAMMEWISALGNSDAQIPMLEGNLIGEINEKGEVVLTNLSAQLVAALQGAKLKPDAKIYAFNVGPNAAAMQKKLNTLVGYEIFQLHEGDEQSAAKAAGIEGGAVKRTHIIFTDESKKKPENQKLAGAQYHFVGGQIDINNLNALALFTQIMQQDTAKINEVLEDLANGTFTAEGMKLVLDEKMRFKVEVAKAILERA